MDTLCRVHGSPPRTPTASQGLIIGVALHNMHMQRDLLAALVRGTAADALNTVDVPAPSPLIVEAADGSKPALAQVASSPDLRTEAFASPLGPILASPLANALTTAGRASELPALVLTLTAPPVSPGPLLNRLLDQAVANPEGTATAAAHLSGLYGALPDAGLPDDVTIALGLPRALGLAWDIAVVAAEAGPTVQGSAPAPVEILNVALAQAGTRSTLELLINPTGIEQVTADAAVLASTALAAFDLAAYATAGRLAILAVLVQAATGGNSAIVAEARTRLMDTMTMATAGGRSMLLMRKDVRALVLTLPSPA